MHRFKFQQLFAGRNLGPADAVQRRVLDADADFVAVEAREVVVGSIKFFGAEVCRKRRKIIGCRLGMVAVKRGNGKRAAQFDRRLDAGRVRNNPEVVPIKTVIRTHHKIVERKIIDPQAEGYFQAAIGQALDVGPRLVGKIDAVERRGQQAVHVNGLARNGHLQPPVDDLRIGGLEIKGLAVGRADRAPHPRPDFGGENKAPPVNECLRVQAEFGVALVPFLCPRETKIERGIIELPRKPDAGAIGLPFFQVFPGIAQMRIYPCVPARSRRNDAVYVVGGGGGVVVGPGGKVNGLHAVYRHVDHKKVGHVGQFFGADAAGHRCIVAVLVVITGQEIGRCFVGVAFHLVPVLRMGEQGQQADQYGIGGSHFYFFAGVFQIIKF